MRNKPLALIDQLLNRPTDLPTPLVQGRTCAAYWSLRHDWTDARGDSVAKAHQCNREAAAGRVHSVRFGGARVRPRFARAITATSVLDEPTNDYVQSRAGRCSAAGQSGQRGEGNEEEWRQRQRTNRTHWGQVDRRRRPPPHELLVNTYLYRTQCNVHRTRQLNSPDLLTLGDAVNSWYHTNRWPTAVTSNVGSISPRHVGGQNKLIHTGNT